MTSNRLTVARADFVNVTKVFRQHPNTKRPKVGPALLAFEGGYVSIESRGMAAVMRAHGEWHGRAGFSGTILHALVTHPPKDDPLMFSYADGHLLLAGMTIRCTWTETGRPLMQALENPDLLDLLALERSLPRAEARSREWKAKTEPALKDRDRRIRLAAKHLGELGISETDIRAMVDRQVMARVERDGDAVPDPEP